jgi:hypothetical protein
LISARGEHQHVSDLTRGEAVLDEASLVDRERPCSPRLATSSSDVAPEFAHALGRRTAVTCNRMKYSALLLVEWEPEGRAQDGEPRGPWSNVADGGAEESLILQRAVDGTGRLHAASSSLWFASSR